ncbi:Uncharacterised protein [Mycobacteroides abscessus subsp. abscessus]|nr:Uncharacterised protein [Mycobacteroides abscessus subsp. abscessus]
MGTAGVVSPTTPVANCADSRSRSSRAAMMSVSPSMAEMSCWRNSPAAGGEPNRGDTSKVLMADPAWLATEAENTRSEFSDNTPAALESRPR